MMAGGSNNPPVQQPNPFFMLSRGEQSAPTVDILRPRTLIHFFKELEPLFARAGITAEQDMKEQVVKYVNMDLEDVWEQYPEFKDATKTYDDFKKAIIAHYPGLVVITFMIKTRQLPAARRV
jgi:hypothetical protein